MRVIIKKHLFDFPNLVGKKVIATEFADGKILVKTSELLRVGVPMEEMETLANEVWAFEHYEYEVVKPKFQNCSDSNVGKGWGGFYDQKPVRRSKFK